MNVSVTIKTQTEAGRGREKERRRRQGRSSSITSRDPRQEMKESEQQKKEKGQEETQQSESFFLLTQRLSFVNPRCHRVSPLVETKRRQTGPFGRTFAFFFFCVFVVFFFSFFPWFIFIIYNGIIYELRFALMCTVYVMFTAWLLAVEYRTTHPVPEAHHLSPLALSVSPSIFLQSSSNMHVVVFFLFCHAICI